GGRRKENSSLRPSRNPPSLGTPFGKRYDRLIGNNLDSGHRVLLCRRYYGKNQNRNHRIRKSWPGGGESDRALRRYGACGYFYATGSVFDFAGDGGGAGVFH